MRSLEIFSGAGGLAKGLELAGCDHAMFVEYNRHACASLAANFGAAKVFCGPIQEFDLGRAGAVDIVAGGPPCQPFSLGGKHKAHQDDRDMFPYAIRAIESLSPKAFVFENVKGLLRPSFAEYFEYIILRLTYPSLTTPATSSWQAHLDTLRRVKPSDYSGIRYEVQFRLVNAADYGVPQTRERVVIVGVRADLNVKWAFPLPTHSEERLVWDQHVSGSYWSRHGVAEAQRPVTNAQWSDRISRLQSEYGLFEPQLLPWVTMRDVLRDLPDPQGAHELADHTFRGGARTYPGHTGSDYDWPSKTVKAGGHGVPGGENMIRFADGSVRYLTVLEAKRIQTFPDNFIISGAWGEAMRQIGNAVPVRLAYTIGNSICKVFGSSQVRSVRSAA